MIFFNLQQDTAKAFFMKSNLLNLAILNSLLLSSLHPSNDNFILLPETSVNDNDRVQSIEIVLLSQTDPITNNTFDKLIQEASEQQNAWHLVAYNVFSDHSLDRKYASKQYFEQIYNSPEGQETILSADNYNILYNGSNFTIEYTDSITNMNLAASLFPNYEALT